MKIRTSTILFVLLILFLSLADTVQSQENYRKGTVMTADGNLMKGFIYDWSEVMNSHKVRFKNTLDDKAIEFTPEEVEYYIIEPDKFYISTELKYSAIRRDAQAQTTDQVEAEVIETEGIFFARVLEGGYASLLYFKDLGDSEHLFIKKGMEDPAELRRSSRIILHEGEYLKKSTDLYKGVITYLFSDCPTVVNSVGKYRLTPTDMSKVVRRYNACVDQGQNFSDRYPGEFGTITYEPPKGKITFGILGGYSLTTITFNNIDASQIKGTDAISLALSVEYNGARWNKRVWWENRLSISPKQCIREGYTLNNNPGLPPTEIGETLVGIRPVDYKSMLKYRLPKGNVSPYVGIGIVWGIPAQEFGFEGNIGVDLLTDKKVVPYFVIRGEATSPNLGSSYKLPIAYVLNFSLGVRTN